MAFILPEGGRGIFKPTHHQESHGLSLRANNRESAIKGAEIRGGEVYNPQNLPNINTIAASENKELKVIAKPTPNEGRITTFYIADVELV